MNDVRIPVIPFPASLVAVGGEGLRLAPGCTVGVGDPVLAALADRFVADVEADCGLRLRVADAGEPADIRLVLQDALPGPAVDVAGVSPTGLDPAGERSRLTITEGGAVVEAVSPEGVFRGLTTLRQLIAAGMGADATSLPAVVVDDAPRYAWRGLSLDVVRTFHGPAQVRRVIDMLALYKLNVLHLHLSDDQGWRLEIPGWPELTGIGAAGALGDRPGGFYTRQEYAELVAYASDRYVTVVPEIDMPGHAGAAIKAYPELGGVTNVLDPDAPRVPAFVRDVIAALAELTPGPFVHIGGDEAFGMDDDDYRRFVDVAREAVAACGKRPVLWQESARSTTAATDIVQHWVAFDASIEAMLRSGDFGSRALPEGSTIPAEFLPLVAEMFLAGKADVARAVERGARILLSPASHLYLDRPYAEPPTDPAQVDRQRKLGLKVYPRLTVEQSFDWDPATAIEGGPEAVAGIEAAIWCETLRDGDALEFMLLPRLPGVAERAWSQPPLSTWDGYRRRLGAQSRVWEERGWEYFTSSAVEWG